MFQAVLEAHYLSSRRDNLSSMCLRGAYAGSGDYVKALTGALSTLGGTHAPLESTHSLLTASDPVAAAERYLNAGLRVPGWGNSFIKGRKDDLWLGVDQALASDFQAISKRIEEVTGLLHRSGKSLFPNPSAYTAATAIALGLAGQFAAYLFVVGRLRGWTEILAEGVR